MATSLAEKDIHGHLHDSAVGRGVDVSNANESRCDPPAMTAAASLFEPQSSIGGVSLCQM
jgi:hypothetical protein